MNVIEVNNLSKKFKLGVYGGKSLRDDLSAWIAKLRGKENPLITIGEKSRLDEKGEFLALTDINFEVKQGEVLGIIGKNGAGKSTLLKLLSRISYPTSGQIRIKGKMASLLEVGTGFHPELTGRENVFLNGAILGMNRNDIAKKFDEIIAFSGIEHHIDTPTKRYSSGMKVRLGFAVAAHLDPEILVIDEVLAVGDAEFQRKCIGKMKDVAGEGRTVLFVSHNMLSVKSLCTRAILLKGGRLVSDNDPDTIVTEYLRDNLEDFSLKREWVNLGSTEHQISILSAEIMSDNYENNQNLFIDNSIHFKLSIFNEIERELNISLQLYGEDGQIILTSGSGRNMISKGIIDFTCHFPSHFFNNIKYFIKLNIVHKQKVIFSVNELIGFEVQEKDREAWYGNVKGLIRPKFKWEYHERKN